MCIRYDCCWSNIIILLFTCDVNAHKCCSFCCLISSVHLSSVGPLVQYKISHMCVNDDRHWTGGVSVSNHYTTYHNIQHIYVTCGFWWLRHLCLLCVDSCWYDDDVFLLICLDFVCLIDWLILIDSWWRKIQKLKKVTHNPTQHISNT